MQLYSYTAMQVALRGIQAAGPNPTRAAVRDGMAAVRNMPSVIGDGMFSIDENREPAYNMAIVQVKGGAWDLAPK